MAGFSKGATKFITEFAQQAGKSVDEIQSFVAKGLGDVKGRNFNKLEVKGFLDKNPLSAAPAKGASDAARARYTRAAEIASDPNASQAARDRASKFLSEGVPTHAVDSSGTGQRGHQTRTTKEQWEAKQQQIKADEAAERRSAAEAKKAANREAAQRDRAQQGGGIYDRVYRGEDGKLHLEKQDFSIDSSGTGQKGHKEHLTKEQWEAKKKQQEAADRKARAARVHEVNSMNKPMEKRTLGERANEIIHGTGDESSLIGGRKTRQANMEQANANINAANQKYIETGKGSAQKLHDKKSYWAEVKGKGKQAPGGNPKLGQNGATAPNSTNPADIAGENATNGLNFDGIADWAKENQLIVAGGLVAGTLLLTDD